VNFVFFARTRWPQKTALHYNRQGKFWGFLDGVLRTEGKMLHPFGGARRMRANAVPGVFSVKNELKIANTKTA